MYNCFWNLLHHGKSSKNKTQDRGLASGRPLSPQLVVWLLLWLLSVNKTVLKFVFSDLITLGLPDSTRAMPPVRTLLFLVPLVKALSPSTTPAKQLSTASSMKARVASQKAGNKKVRTMSTCWIYTYTYTYICTDCAARVASPRSHKTCHEFDYLCKTLKNHLLKIFNCK